MPTSSIPPHHLLFLSFCVSPIHAFIALLISYGKPFLLLLRLHAGLQVHYEVEDFLIPHLPWKPVLRAVANSTSAINFNDLSTKLTSLTVRMHRNDGRSERMKVVALRRSL